jgi:hypothetical protein
VDKAEYAVSLLLTGQAGAETSLDAAYAADSMAGRPGRAIIDNF